MDRNKYWVRVMLLCVALLAAYSASALAQATDSLEVLHTVTYRVKGEGIDAWFPYMTEQVKDGYLAKGPSAPPRRIPDVEGQVFLAWYEDEACTIGPFNPLRTPITVDMSLYADFGDEADIPVLEGIVPIITLTCSIVENQAEAEEPQSAPPAAETEQVPEATEATETTEAEAEEPQSAILTAEIENVPEGVCYDLQWQSGLSGELADVPGETGLSITFPATEENLNCGWRLRLTF